jgi:phosphatidylserine/phosphatidylglycerophosphate/cardiolipin synthase-like enzyme
MKYAVAIANDDIAYLYWHYNEKIDGCLGFSILRHEADSSGPGEPLGAFVGFPSAKATATDHDKKTTNDWPVQKYSWKDLGAKRGESYWYEIVPMLGTPGSLKPDATLTLRTNVVSLSHDYGDCSVYFNRGIISTQALSRALSKGNHRAPSTKDLKDAIQDPKSSIRAMLEAELNQGVMSLLDRAQKEGGECYCALYEFDDPELLAKLQSLKDSQGQVHLILSNADGTETEDSTGEDGEPKKKSVTVVDQTNEETRKTLHDAGVDITDRIMKNQHIGHNKFIVYVDKGGAPKAVLSGSTNWTPSGLCAQSNNAIVIESDALAQDYLAYWRALKKDTDPGGQVTGNGSPAPTAEQSQQFRSRNAKELSEHNLDALDGKPGGTVKAWFSPNTKLTSFTAKVQESDCPPDLTEVFGLIEAAKQGVIFLAFIPGRLSIVTKIQEVYRDKIAAKQLFFIRGAATDTAPAAAFQPVQLFHATDQSDRVDRELPPDGRGKPDASVVSVMGIQQAFGQWEAEIYKLGHAVIHDKIIVIDPFTESPVVVVGSHNLGFRASFNNDENFVIIRDNKRVASAYAAHVLDVYEHYRWRWRLQQPIRDAVQKEIAAAKAAGEKPKSAEIHKEVMQKLGKTYLKNAWHFLKDKDSWQDYYYDPKNQTMFASELNFWSPLDGVAIQPGAQPPAAGAAAAPKRRARAARRPVRKH